MSRRSLAAIARDATSSAAKTFVNFGSSTGNNTPALRQSVSSGSLSQQALASSNETDPHIAVRTTPEGLLTTQYKSDSSVPRLSTRSESSPSVFQVPSGRSDSPPTNAHKRTLSKLPSAHLNPVVAPENMHQTSSRLLRMTEDDRPFTKVRYRLSPSRLLLIKVMVQDFKDLFATLIVSLPLSPHRVRFTRIDHTFTSEEAINNLGSLKFSQSNRMPDPKDPSRIVTTTTTTTFSMAKEMARSVCQRFMDARFVESADGKSVTHFPIKGAVWQMTPKGLYILQRFCQRNGINARHVLDALESPRNSMHLVILEREAATDKLAGDRASTEVIFRRFAGQEGPNIKSSVATSDSDSLNEYQNGYVGVKLAKERKIFDKTVHNTFTGKAAVDWLMDCCTTIDRRETIEMAASFLKQGLIWAVVEDKVYIHQNPGASVFQPTKNAIYGFTDRGQRVIGWIAREKSAGSGQDPNTKNENGKAQARDSNNSRLINILNDAALRLLFREFLADSLCEENLSFYQDVKEFTTQYHAAEKAKLLTKLDAVRETLAAAYGMQSDWFSFFCTH